MDPTPPPTFDTSARRVLLAVSWCFFVFFVGLYTTIVAALADRRAQDLTPRLDPLAADLPAALAYGLPVVLLVAGLAAYRHFALAPSQRNEPAQIWGRVQRGFFVMMACFELNALAGLSFFLLGSSIEQFFFFAGTSCLLFVAGLWQLLSTWPRDAG